MKQTYRLYTDTKMRSLLGRFLFRGDDVFLSVASLSGGEKARLALLKLMLSGANTLLLDEPTNHMDIESKEVFEEALAEFPGTAIIISHDRYFLQKIPDRILELSAGGITEFLGKYDYYMEKKAQITSGRKYLSQLPAGAGSCGGAEGPGDLAASGVTAELSAEERRRLNKKLEAEQRKTARQKQSLEEQLSAYEKEIGELEMRMCAEENASDYELLAELGTRLEQLKGEYEDTFERLLLLEE